MTDRLAGLYPLHLQTLTQRHDRALAESGYDHAVIFAGAIRMAFLDDMPYPFKPNPHFKAWVPVLDNPNCYVVYTPGQRPRLIYFQPVDYWYKPAANPSGYWVDHFDIKIIATPEDAKQHFPRNGRVAFIGEDQPTPEPLLNRLHFDRAWKTEYEIECMRRANRIGARAHRAAERAFRSGASEYEIHLDYLQAANSTEEELPYANIIGLNENAAVLHYIQHDRRRLEEQRRFSFLIDAGANVNGYASDITRTHSQRDDEFAQMIQAFDAGQQELCAAVKPKISYPDLHMNAHRMVAKMLEQFRFTRDIDAGGIVEKGISSTFFPHGVGHYIGLQVHDVAGFMADRTGKSIPKPEGHPHLRLTRTVEPTHVFTVEPGMYFIEPLLADLKKSANAKYINWPKVDDFRKFGGIRIEDDVVVTASGHENLTRAAFAET
ncbi:MAG: Xaa-Pro dipeptidase [Acidobacteria bacterium]|nr:MAG: Xaa-Pro dipeptidase [Acidobacteriota bacterium]